MQMRGHRGFEIQVHKKGGGYVAEIYHRQKMIRTVRNAENPEGHFHMAELAAEAARGWIDFTYPPGRVKYLGEVD